MAMIDPRDDLNRVSGMHIYEDDKGRKIYYQPRKMIGYVIQQEHVRTYTTMANRYMMTMIAGILSYMVLEYWNQPVLFAIPIALAVLIFMEIRFRTKFLPALVQLHNFVPKKKASKVANLATQEQWRLLSKAILYPTLGILLLLNFYLKDVSIPMYYIGGIILIITLLFGGFQVYALLYKRKYYPLHTPQPKKKL